MEIPEKLQWFLSMCKQLVVHEKTPHKELATRIDIMRNAWRVEDFVLVPARFYDDHVEFLHRLNVELMEDPSGKFL
jgi:hypothetical protein